MNRYELLRFERGLTQADVADASGVPLSTIRYLESQADVKPTAPTVKALADFYELPVAEFLGLKDVA